MCDRRTDRHTDTRTDGGNRGSWSGESGGGFNGERYQLIKMSFLLFLPQSPLTMQSVPSLRLLSLAGANFHHSLSHTRTPVLALTLSHIR